MSNAALTPPESLSSKRLFIVLNLFTMGLYSFWFMYKMWRYLAQREQRDLLPILRAIFSVFFFHQLAESVSRLDGQPDAQQTRMNALYILCILLSFLPDPWWVLSFLSLVPLTRLHSRAAAMRWSDGSAAFYTSSFAPRHAFLVLLGMVMWYGWWTLLTAPAYPY